MKKSFVKLITGTKEEFEKELLELNEDTTVQGSVSTLLVDGVVIYSIVAYNPYGFKSK